jgi:hypothetical protein
MEGSLLTIGRRSADVEGGLLTIAPRSLVTVVGDCNYYKQYYVQPSTLQVQHSLMSASYGGGSYYWRTAEKKPVLIVVPMRTDMLKGVG